MKSFALLTAAALAATVLAACGQDPQSQLDGRGVDDPASVVGAADGEGDDDHDEDLHGDDDTTLASIDPKGDDDPALGADDIVIEDETEDEIVDDTDVEEMDGEADVDFGSVTNGTQTLAAKRVKSPVPGRGVTYRYGVRNRRYKAGFHTGQDHAAARGRKVVAVRSGKIRWSNGRGGAYGNWIGLDAGGRTYVYCHLSSRSVKSGQKVKAGQVIGRVGATGNVTGPHLHFEDHPKGPFRYAQVRKPRW